MNFSNKMSKNLKRFAKSKMNGFLTEIQIPFTKKSSKKILNIVCIVHYVAKTLTLNTRAELTLLGTSMVMLILKAQEAKRKQPGIDSIFLKPLESQVRRAEVKVTSFIVEHNIPLVVSTWL